MKTQPIPQGISMITPHLVVKDADKAIQFYKDVFCAQEMYRMMTPDGKNVMHACVNIAGQTVFVADAMNGMKAPGKTKTPWACTGNWPLTWKTSLPKK